MLRLAPWTTAGSAVNRVSHWFFAFFRFFTSASRCVPVRPTHPAAPEYASASLRPPL